MARHLTEDEELELERLTQEVTDAIIKADGALSKPVIVNRINQIVRDYKEDQL